MKLTIVAIYGVVAVAVAAAIRTKEQDSDPAENNQQRNLNVFSDPPVSYPPVFSTPVSGPPVSYTPVSYAPASDPPISYAPVSYAPVSQPPVVPSPPPISVAPTDPPVTPTNPPVTPTNPPVTLTVAPSQQPVGCTCEDATEKPCDFFGNDGFPPPCADDSPHGGDCDDWKDLKDSLKRACNLACPLNCQVRYLEPAEYVCCDCDDRVRVGSYECPVLNGVCGDGLVNPGEECDDGNAVNNDFCNNNCEIVVCGDGVVTDPEQCDDGDANGPAPAPCSESCETYVPGCGDGIVNPGEECDDGNSISGDGCSSSCLSEVCGNGRVDHGEQCDLGAGNADPPNSSCTTTCTVYTPRCGDGYLNSGEDCDDANYNACDGCTSSCRSEVCGNGIVDCGETCDDGNTVDGDGCSANCTYESPPSASPGPGTPSGPCVVPPPGTPPPSLEMCAPPQCACDSVPEPFRYPAEVACNTAGAVFDPASIGGTLVVVTELAALAPEIMCRNLRIKDLLPDPNQDPDHYECVCDRQERFCNPLCICAWTIFQHGQTAGIFTIDFEYTFGEALDMCHDQGY